MTKNDDLKQYVCARSPSRGGPGHSVALPSLLDPIILRSVVTANRKLTARCCQLTPKETEHWPEEMRRLKFGLRELVPYIERDSHSPILEFVRVKYDPWAVAVVIPFTASTIHLAVKERYVLEIALQEELAFLWDSIVKASDDELSPPALKAKYQLMTDWVEDTRIVGETMGIRTESNDLPFSFIRDELGRLKAEMRTMMADTGAKLAQQVFSDWYPQYIGACLERMMVLANAATAAADPNKCAIGSTKPPTASEAFAGRRMRSGMSSLVPNIDTCPERMMVLANRYADARFTKKE